MARQIRLGTVAVDVVLKDIKNVHLSVYPPTGRVRVAAPSRMPLDAIRAFVVSRLGWIKRQQQRLRAQERETPREYLERESHYVWGARYLLTVTEADRPPAVTVKPGRMVLAVRPGAGEAARAAVVAQWYREQVKAVVTELLAKWERRLRVHVERVFVQQMKTRWGSCNPPARTIRLNTELAKKPKECLEYIVVHEMLHLIEPRHNDRFVSLMDAHLPAWRVHRAELNRAPLAHVEWKY